MDKFSIEEYKVSEKGRTYSVLVFPEFEYMWAFDDWPEKDCYMIDGTVDVYSVLKYAMAILFKCPEKIIYFPCKQDGIGNYYKENYNLILCTPKAQLKRSSWLAVRRKLIPSNRKRNFHLYYDHDKLIDICEKKLMFMESRGTQSELSLKMEIYKKIEKEHLEELLGENLFMVLGRDECLYNYHSLTKDIEEYRAEDEYGAWTVLGWIVTHRGLENMKEESLTLK